jgi:tight adherence protein B
MLIFITITIFLAVLGLFVSGLYFLVVAPADRKKTHFRLQALQQISAPGKSEFEQETISELQNKTSPLSQVLMQIPLVKRLQLFLLQADVGTSAVNLISIVLGVAFIICAVGSLAGLSLLTTSLSTLVPFAIPFLVIVIKRHRRLSKFEELFPAAIDFLARSVRAGHAFTTGLELISDEMPEPVAGEFRTTFNQHNLGLPLKDALQNMTVRIPSPDMAIFVSGLQIQRETGGNLAEILDKLSYVIRERFKLYRQIQVYTAEGRMSLYVLTALPPLTAVLMYLSNRNYLDPLFEDPLGHQMIMAAIVMQTIGYFVIRMIIRIKV